jgi:hypothetical protein
MTEAMEELIVVEGGWVSRRLKVDGDLPVSVVSYSWKPGKATSMPSSVQEEGYCKRYCRMLYYTMQN